MPTARQAGSSEPKRRSRNGCWPCKGRKIKCGEEKPRCLHCERLGDVCDYSLKLNWEGRSKKKPDAFSVTTAVGARGATSPNAPASAPAEPKAGTQISLSNGQPPKRGPRPRHSSFDEKNLASVFSSDPNSRSSDHVTWARPKRSSSDALILQRPSTSGYLGSTDQQLQRRHDPNAGEYPSPLSSTSPNDPSVRADGLIQPFAIAPDLSQSFLQHSAHTSDGRPTNFVFRPQEPAEIAERSSKRTKFNVTSEPVSQLLNNEVRQDSPLELQGNVEPSIEPQTPRIAPPTPRSPFLSAPVTPGSSEASDDARQRIRSSTSSQNAHGSHKFRRLSVQSLLSSPSGGDNDRPHSSQDFSGLPDSLEDMAATASYGYDCGEPDLDIPQNDDQAAIKSMTSPISFYAVPRSPAHTFKKGGYYARPVDIRIPQSFQPLPARLLQNPINILYFHHFLNHTARILVPHDCEQNPFRNTLPELALRDDDVLCLLLAYSACHRARLLGHREPAKRIATWVENVFPKLRKALEDGYIADANLTTAIMLASLEIISPNTFGVPVSWQSHLQVARQMIIIRGGSDAISRRDKVAFLLSRWFAYLDVLGSLSGRKNDKPLSPDYWSMGTDSEESWQIDCLLGFPMRYLEILAKIAVLAKQCESERLDEEGNVRQNWRPTPEISMVADGLRQDLKEGREHLYMHCNNQLSCQKGMEQDWDSVEISATNEIFHWAGLIHLCRRVLGKAPQDPEVQNAVQETVSALGRIRQGGTAEACLLFPMFTAGCDAIHPDHRWRIMERLKGIEGLGMLHVQKARDLMLNVWKEEKPWETLVTGEFFG